MNNVTIVGRLTKDPELRSTPQGMAVLEMRIAIDRAGDKNTDGTFKAGFFDATVWGTQAETCAKYLMKGSQVGVVGELRFSEWEKEGQKRSKVGVTARWVEFLGTKGDGGGGSLPGEPSIGDSDIPF